MKKKCEVNEGCNRKVRYSLFDHKLNKGYEFCEAHFKAGIRAWLEPNPIIGHLMNEGIL